MGKTGIYIFYRFLYIYIYIKPEQEQIYILSRHISSRTLLPSRRMSRFAPPRFRARWAGLKVLIEAGGARERKEPRVQIERRGGRIFPRGGPWWHRGHARRPWVGPVWALGKGRRGRWGGRHQVVLAAGKASSEGLGLM